MSQQSWVSWLGHVAQVGVPPDGTGSDTSVETLGKLSCAIKRHSYTVHACIHCGYIGRLRHISLSSGCFNPPWIGDGLTSD